MLAESLSIGDGIEIHSKNLPGNPVEIDWSITEVNRKTGNENRKESGEKTSEEELFLYLYRAHGNEKLAQSYKRIYVPYEAVLSGLYEDDDRIVPEISDITKVWREYNIRKNFDKIVAVSCKKGIMIDNVSWIEPFSKSGVNVFADYGLNLYNSADYILACELGIVEAVVFHEADIDDIFATDFH